MRILEVVHGFPPLAESGCEVYAHAHARALAKHFADDVLVLTREENADRPEYSVRWERRDGLRIVRINNTFRHIRSFEDSYCNGAIGARAARLIDDFRPDVAHVHHLTCLSTAIVPLLAERRVPCFMTLHDYWLICHRGQLFDVDHRACDLPDGSPGSCGRCLGSFDAAPPSAFLAAHAIKRLESTVAAGALRPAMSALTAFAKASALKKRCAATVEPLLRNAKRGASEAERRVAHMRAVVGDVTRFLAPSHFIRDRFIRFGVPTDRILDSPYGFDHEPFQGRAVEHHIQSESRPLRLGFVGSLMVSKAPHVLIEAVKSLTPGVATVDLFGAYTPYHGDDGYWSRLKPLLALPDVRHHGHVPHRNIPDALASIDLLVVPSVWPENSPLVIQEAFLAGIPVIASRIGGIPELVEHDRNGLLFEPGSVEDLRRTLARFLVEPRLLERLRDGIRPARTIEDDVAATREMYVRIAGGKACATKDGKVVQGFSPAKDSHHHRIAAVVLNYHTPDDTFLAVRSLQASRRRLDEIIVVDNDAALKGPRYDNCRYMQTGRNLGFSGGVNVGIRAALERGADAVLLVNSDAIVPPDCLERLERTMNGAAADGSRSIVAPVIASRSAPGIVATRGISYESRNGRMRHCGVGIPVERLSDDADSSTGIPVDAVSACVVLIRRDVFDAIGLFDEDYFFSFEDLDFCLRARRAGFETVLAADATAYHEGSRSIGAGAPERLYFAARNHLLLASRATATSSIVRHGYRMSSIVMLNVAHAILSNGASLPRRLSAVARGTRDYFASRFGAGARSTE